MKIHALKPNITVQKAASSCIRLQGAGNKSCEKHLAIANIPAFYNNISFNGGGYGFFLKALPKMPCAYTGKTVINPKETKQYLNGIEHLRGKRLSSRIKQYTKELDSDSVQKQVANIIATLANKNPRLSINQILKNMVKNAEKSDIVISTKKQLFSSMNKLSDQTYKELKPFVDDLNKRKTRRHINYLLEKYPDSKQNEALKSLHCKVMEMTTSKQDKQIYILTYANPNNPQAFLKSIIEPITSSVEHIKPHYKGSQNEFDVTSNYLITSRKINSERGHSSLKEWVRGNPQVIDNMQNYMDEICSRLDNFEVQQSLFKAGVNRPHFNKLIDKALSYPSDIATQIFKETDGEVNLKFKQPKLRVKFENGKIKKLKKA